MRALAPYYPALLRGKARPKIIQSIKFGLLSPEVIRKMSVAEIKIHQAYDPSSGKPVPGGVLDPRLGVVEPGQRCATCGKPAGECPGHFGHIELAYPVYHIEFIPEIHSLARSVCEHCGRILLTDEEKEKYKKMLEQTKWDRKMYNKTLKAIEKECLAKRQRFYLLYTILSIPWSYEIPESANLSSKVLLIDIGPLESLIKELSNYKTINEALKGIDDVMFHAPLESLKEFGIQDVKVAEKILELYLEIRKEASEVEDIVSYYLNNVTKETKLELFRGKINIPGIEPRKGEEIFEILKRNIERFHEILTLLVQNCKNEALKPFLEGMHDEISKLINTYGADGLVREGAYVDSTITFQVPYDLIREALHFSGISPGHCPHCGKPLCLDVALEKPYKFYALSVDAGGFLDSALRELYEAEGGPKRASEVVEKLRKKAKKNPQGRGRIFADKMRALFEKIPDEDLPLFDFDPESSRPEWMIIKVLPVPPVTVRPTITMQSGQRSEDDLTHKLVEIIKANNKLYDHKNSGAPQIVIEDVWDLLQYHIATYIDNEVKGLPVAQHKSGKPIKSLAERLKGKEGRFRGNLTGKRVNYSARTVISPDPYIGINEVGVPYEVAKELTIPVIVTEYNLEEIRQLIRNGPNVHPGANYVVRPDMGRVKITESNKEKLSKELSPGWIVERHLMDGDIVLFNRQPSLHRMSIMGHVVRVLPYKTFRLNLAVCSPYNADFDGDEMNMHALQSEEARAEARVLMKVQEHILSPRFGGPIIGAIHDHVSGLFILTNGERLYDKDEVSWFFSAIGYDGPLPPPDKVIDGKEYWIGKKIFSLLLPKDLNLTFEAKIASTLKTEEEKEKEDAIVTIRNGKLIKGSIDDEAVGAFAGRIIGVIARKHGFDVAREFIDKMTLLGIYSDMLYGFTTGISDEDIPEDAKRQIEDRLREAIEKVEELIKRSRERNIEGGEDLERRILGELNEARNEAGEIAARHLGLKSHAVLMARCGARAKMLDLTQIAGSVGQQTIRGERINRGFYHRTTSHFKRDDLGARAHGFVISSYKDGLDPIEYFFHSASGREGLVDTAVRTSRSGYMQRRMMNALDSVRVEYDGTVRDCYGHIIQFRFGEDGVDPTRSCRGRPVDLERIIDDIKNMAEGGE